MFCPVCGSRIRNENGVCTCGFIDPTVKKPKPVEPTALPKAEIKPESLPSEADSAPITPPAPQYAPPPSELPPVYTPPAQPYFAPPVAPTVQPAEAKGMKWHSFYQVAVFFDVIANLIVLLRFNVFGLFKSLSNNISSLYGLMACVASIVLVFMGIFLGISLGKRKYGTWEKLRGYYKFYIIKSVLIYIVASLLNISGWMYDNASILKFIIIVCLSFVIRKYYKNRRHLFVN